ncbi:Hypothetical predicted protein, partial [Paramuricea clavata]
MIRVLDHLTPKAQFLLYEANKFKSMNNYAYWWAENNSVFLCEQDNKRKSKRSELEDLRKLAASANDDPDNPDLPAYNFEYVPTPLSAVGVGMYIADNINYSVIERTSNIYFQALWIELAMGDNRSIVCGVVYRQHNDTTKFVGDSVNESFFFNAFSAYKVQEQISSIPGNKTYGLM